MDFQTLHETIPYARYGKEKSLEMKPYPDITLAMPGRHAEDCSPKGGDFVVMVTDKNLGWKRHQFKHSDLFDDIQAKLDACTVPARLMDLSGFMGCYYSVITGGDADMKLANPDWLKHTMHPQTFLHAVQCLAVAEHRRYAMHETKFGGRYLPFRFVAGIAEGLWTADAGSEVQKYGRPAVERLEKKNGLPALTKKLMNV